jgi:hypothetical protein
MATMVNSVIYIFFNHNFKNAKKKKIEGGGWGGDRCCLETKHVLSVQEQGPGFNPQHKNE